jgi:hypothetical protein
MNIRLTALLLSPLTLLSAGNVSTDTWTEKWPVKAGQVQTLSVTSEVWTAAFLADLDADGQLHIPAREKPYSLDGPLVMKSGQKLTAELLSVNNPLSTARRRITSLSRRAYNNPQRLTLSILRSA